MGIASMIARVFGDQPDIVSFGQTLPNVLPTTIEEQVGPFGFIYPLGETPHNVNRDRRESDAIFPFTNEEYKKIRDEIETRPELTTRHDKDLAFREAIKNNPRWLPQVNDQPKRDLKASSSAVASLRILPDNKIGIRYNNGTKEYTYYGGPTLQDAAKAVKELLDTHSIGRAVNTKIKGSWGSVHYDHGHG
jgi:hypothetical protein